MPPKFNDQALRFTALHQKSPQNSPTRPASSSAFNRPLSAASQKSQNTRPQSGRMSQTPAQVPINAHPSEVVAAYERLVHREAQSRGTTYNLSQYQTMADEIQALRKERKDLQDKFRLQKTETIKLEQKNSSLIKEIEMLARQPLQLNEMFRSKQIDYVALKSKESQPSLEYVKSLKRKIRELYEANQELQEYVKTMNERTKVVKLMELEKSFRVYFDRYNQLRQQNQDIQVQLTEIAQENVYLKKRLEYSENQPLNVNHELVDDVDLIMQNQRPDIQALDDKSEDFQEDTQSSIYVKQESFKPHQQSDFNMNLTSSNPPIFKLPSRNTSITDISTLPDVSNLVDSLQKKQMDLIKQNKQSQDQILLDPVRNSSENKLFGQAHQFAQDYSEIDNESHTTSQIVEPLNNQTFGPELCGVTQVSESETVSISNLQQSVQYNKMNFPVQKLEEVEPPSLTVSSKVENSLDSDVPSIDVNSNMFGSKPDDIPSINITSHMFESKMDDVPSINVNTNMFESKQEEIPSIDVNSNMFESKLGKNDSIPSIDVNSHMFESKPKESELKIAIPKNSSQSTQLLSSRRESIKQDLESLLD